MIIVMLLEISLLYIIISHYKLAKPLEAIKQGMMKPANHPLMKQEGR